MVTAIRFGPRASRLRQRAASASSAVESGPPDTANNNERASARSANRTSASASETRWSATGTLLFPLGGLLHAVRRARVFPGHFAQGRASELALAQRGERLAEAQQRVRCLPIGFVFLRHVEERGRGVAIILTLEHALAKPELRVRRHPIARMFLQEGAQCVLGQRVILAQQIAIAEIILITRRLGRRQGRDRASGIGTA